MIRIFQKIRAKLLSESKIRKYLVYGIGEIFLIMIGIFMAFQLQNWNEERKQSAQFEANLKQIYNTINVDVEMYGARKANCMNEFRLVEILLENPDSIPFLQMPYAIYSLGLDRRTYISETAYHAHKLNPIPDNKDQLEITRQISNYVNRIETLDNSELLSHADPIRLALAEIEIPAPKIEMNKPNAGWVTTDSSYYSQKELEDLYELVRSHKFRAFLKTYRGNLIYRRFASNTKQSDGLSILNWIKKSYPDVKIAFQDLGIIGTSLDGFDDEGGRSTPLILTDAKNSVWEADLYLKEGKVKFRCRDSWAQNWGGMSFPKGELHFDGRNIAVTAAGNYHIRVNLTEKTYEFIKQEDPK